MPSAREASRMNYNDSGTHESISLGCLQRIADATELMAKNYVAMQAELDRYKFWYLEERKRREKLERRLRAMRGVATKRKAKLEQKAGKSEEIQQP